jgi:hypothetical protein
MNRNHFFLALALLGVTAANPTSVLAAPAFALPAAADDDAAYAAGTRALNERRWADAVTSFEAAVNAKGKKVDAALYWKAYALNKLGKQSLAHDTCAQLSTQFKDSTWNKDCNSLSSSLADVKDHSLQRDPEFYTYRDHRTSRDPDTEMKILAVNSLMHRDPAQAMPIMRAILTGEQPMEIKQQALFALAQNKSPEADTLMRDLVAGKMGPELQLQAIQSSGIYRGRTGNDGLAEAYRSSSDPKVKHAVISAYFIANDDNHLVELARQEKDLELKRRIVSQLSLMKGKAAGDYMMELLK